MKVYAIVFFIFRRRRCKEAIAYVFIKEQYEIGIEAGKRFSKMHTYEAPKDLLPWYERAMKNIKNM